MYGKERTVSLNTVSSTNGLTDQSHVKKEKENKVAALNHIIYNGLTTLKLKVKLLKETIRENFYDVGFRNGCLKIQHQKHKQPKAADKTAFIEIKDL
jgi:hypothetical protein